MTASHSDTFPATNQNAALWRDKQPVSFVLVSSGRVCVRSPDGSTCFRSEEREAVYLNFDSGLLLLSRNEKLLTVPRTTEIGLLLLHSQDSAFLVTTKLA